MYNIEQASICCIILSYAITLIYNSRCSILRRDIPTGQNLEL